MHAKKCNVVATKRKPPRSVNRAPRRRLRVRASPGVVGHGLREAGASLGGRVHLSLGRRRGVAAVFLRTPRVYTTD